MHKLALIIYSICNKSEHGLKEYSGRKREFVQPKQVHMALLHKVFGVSTSIAGSVYGLDHCTALHAAKTVANLYQTDKRYALLYKDAFDHCRSYDSKKTDDYLNGRES